MEITVIRTADRRRMVVAVEAPSEREALRAIHNAVGAVVLVPEHPAAWGRQTDPARHARHASYF